MKAGKRLLSLALIVLLCLSLLPVGVMADEEEAQASEEPLALEEILEEEPAEVEEPAVIEEPAEVTAVDEEELILDGVASGTCGENVTWTLVDGVLTISGTGPMYEYPRQFGDDIIEKDTSVFYDWRTEIVSVVIEEGVTSIGEWTFHDCSSLTSVVLPDSLTSIGDGAFSGCSSLIRVTIPDGVTSIGEFAFYDCSGLTSVELSDSLTGIAYCMFCRCSSLTSITIPENVTSIEQYAFEYCSSLTSITIPESVTSIGSEAFSVCSRLTSVTLPAGLTEIAFGLFSLCENLESVTILGNVTSIGGYAFYKCSSLTSITIPESVTSLGEYAFAECSSLTSIALPESVTGIEKCAFSGCTSLTGVTIRNQECSIQATRANVLGVPKNVTIYGYTASTAQAFANAYGYAFSALDAPDEPVVPAENKNVVYSGSCGTNVAWLLTEEGVLIVCGSGEMNNYAEIGYNYPPWKAYQASISAVVIESGVTRIGSEAFKGCTGLTNAVILPLEISIRQSAFPSETVLSGYEGSDVQTYAETYGYTFVVLSDLSGDVDGNGRVNLKDVTLLFQYVNGQITADKVPDVKAADVDGDNDVTLKDVTKLFQFVNGQITAL